MFLSLKHINLLLALVVVTINVFQGTERVKRDTSGFKKSASIYYQMGRVVPSHGFIRGENPMNEPYRMYHAFSLRYNIHLDGRKPWQQYYAYPVWGIGLYGAWFENDNNQLGMPLAAYLFVDLPLRRWKNWTLDHELAFGMAFNWNRRELLENNFYYPIGSSSTVYIDIGFNATFHLTRQLDLSAGFTFTHFSNGAIQLPNLGVNMLGTRVELRYLFQNRPEFISQHIPKYQKEWEWLILVAPSMKQVGFEYIATRGDTLAQTFNYGIITLSSTLNRQISHKVKFGIGADLSYNAAYGADTLMLNGEPEKAPANAWDKLLFGLYPSFELVLGKLSMIAQPGIYIYKKDLEGIATPTTYQRIGLKYHFVKNVIFGINIRAYNFSKADFIEWNIGYRIKWGKNSR